MHYQYRALNRKGQSISGLVEATNERLALRELEKQGLTPVEIKPQSSKRNLGGSRKKPTTQDILLLFEQLQTLLKSGISLHVAISSLANSSSNQQLTQEMKTIASKLDQGESFSSALEETNITLPNYVIQLVHSGEMTGKLNDALAGCVKQLRYDEQVRKEFMQALTYPIILIFSGIFAVGLIFVAVVPKFANLLKQGEELPFLAWAVLSSGVFVNTHQTAFLVGAGVLVLAVLVASQSQAIRKQLLNFSAHLPGIGTLVIGNQVARWSGLLGVLLTNKVPILEALALANRSVTLTSFQLKLDLLADKVKEGALLSERLQQIHLLTPVALDLVKVGEKTGKLADMFTAVSSLYSESVRDRVQKLLKLMEPVSILVIGSMIGLIMTGVILAITSLNDAAF